MNKRKIGILGLVAFLMFSPRVHATCDYETQVKLAREAANVNAISEVKNIATGNQIASDYIEFDENDEPVYTYEDEVIRKVVIDVYNLTENLYFTIESKQIGFSETVHYEDLVDGTYSLENDNLDEIITYEIRVFSAHGDCNGEELKKIEVTTPKFNEFSTFEACDNSNAYFCQEFVTTDINMTVEEFYAKIDEMTQEEQKTEDGKKEENFWNKYGNYFVIGGITIIILAGVTTAAIVIKKRRSRVL